jgi:hypothetical protein
MQKKIARVRRNLCDVTQTVDQLYPPLERAKSAAGVCVARGLYKL